MKHYSFKLIFTMLCFVNIFYYSQNYRIDYDLNYKKDSLSDEISHEKMVLLTTKNRTKFVSNKQLINDSLNILNEEKGIKNPIQYDYDFMTINDTENQKIKKYKLIIRDLYEVSTPKIQFDWKVENETKKIGNYSCQKASLDYCNRHWEAWFTTDVPLNVGPYIFDGLPGLILELKDSKGNFEFTFSGIQKSNLSPDLNLNYVFGKPLSVNKNQLEKALKDYYKDPYREMKMGKILVVYQDENGNSIKPDYNELTKGEQDRIKKENNPIELCEAIKYSK